MFTRKALQSAGRTQDMTFEVCMHLLGKSECDIGKICTMYYTDTWTVPHKYKKVLCLPPLTYCVKEDESMLVTLS